MNITLDHNLKLNSLPLDRETNYQISEKESRWILDLLNELAADDEIPTNFPGQYLNAKIDLTRKKNEEYKEHLIVSVSLQGKFATPCIRCLEPHLSPIELDFAACFLPADLLDEEMFKDLDTIFTDEKEADIHPYQNNRLIDLKELIHENIYLHKDPFPLHDPECKGLCSCCGTNLNLGNCSKNKQS